MRRAIVTVSGLGASAGLDLEVPADTDAAGLAAAIARVLRPDLPAEGRYTLEAYPLSRSLRPDETLAVAGVWDGAWLVVKDA